MKYEQNVEHVNKMRSIFKWALPVYKDSMEKGSVRVF